MTGLLLAAPCMSGVVGASPAPSSGMARILVLSQASSTDTNPRSRTWIYIEEVLRQAGLFFERIDPDAIEQVFERHGTILLLAGNLRLTTRQREALNAWVQAGGTVLGIGGTSGLREVFGVAGEKPLAEGWMKVSSPDHPLTSGLRSSLHVFGGYAVQKGPATSLAEVQGGSAAISGSAVLENACGKGRAVLLAPDLLFSIVHIQQGIRVLQDGKPSPDGTAAVNDGVLKAEDGMVLDWQRDRLAAEPDQGAIFLEPVSDELRELIIRSIFHLARESGMSLPVLWYWPRGLKGIAHMSHDSDGNDPGKALALFKVMNRCQVKSTWCILYPGGYSREFFRSLSQEQFEIALHFDAMTGGEKSSWSKENFFLQHQWLMKEAGLDRITTNKNHYTRWEGRLDLPRWCEEAGIHADQSRGPSKKGTIGFPLGGSQPYFPLDEESEKIRFLKTLEINLLTQDLVVTCPPAYGAQLMDSALRHHGVGHFLFHPAHIQKPGVAEALTQLVDHARAKGMEWWTARQIFEWESQRRAVTGIRRAAGEFKMTAGTPLNEATLLVLKPKSAPGVLTANGHELPVTTWNLHGFDFLASTLDVSGVLDIQWRPQRV